MKRARIISRILFYFSRTMGLGYLVTTLYSILCLLTGWFILPYKDNYIHINLPFTQTAFLNLELNMPYIIFSFLLPLTLYSAFFWLASNVFRVFTQPKLFTEESLKQLRLFYIFNLFPPIVLAIIASFFVSVESAVWILVVVHFVLGIFAYFLAAIFKQGLDLQKDQDLYI
ncbi:DUF2975 domain-containing protein [Pedobacter nototheniae]|uniref:DUF2975 domain-containing protein n=1 Tax=Pedobacter nototheniae TaxID=2488994 RepID=UPI00292FE607|nr:DUF2975 domain-containing protein [Pedobacter nototheniae]